MTRRFIQPDEIFNEVQKFQEQLKTDPEHAKLSDKFGKVCYDLANNIISARNWRRYPLDQRNEMISEALYRCVRAASRAKLELGPKKVFSYFTRTVYLSFLNVVMNNYKQVERKNTYIRIELEKLGVSDMKIDEILGRKKDEKYNTGMMKDFWVNSSYKTEEKRKAEAQQK